MQRSDIENLLIMYGKMMGDKNFTPGYSGNMSHRFGENFLITTSGSANAHLTHDEIVWVDINGKNLENNSKKPSSEALMHFEIYKKRPDINAILHVHSPYLSAFASSGKSLEEPVMAEIAFYFGKIPLADYALPSSFELAEKTAKYFDEYDAVLMANHGFVIGAKDIKDAYMKLELAESYAQVVINTNIIGGAKLLTKEQQSAILAMRNK